MPPFPPISVSASSSASNGPFGAGGNGWSQGDWNPVIAGSGTALQAGGSLPSWLIVAGIVGAAWFLLNR